METGVHLIRWECDDANGRPLPPGIYRLYILAERGDHYETFGDVEVRSE
jgi:hypothetical protein